MAKKDQFISCPSCQKEISAYALLCPHCCQRIKQTDFGKAKNESVSTGPTFDRSTDHSTNSSLTTLFMVVMIFATATGIYFRFGHQVTGFWKENQPFSVSISKEDFDKMCRDGVAMTMYSDYKDSDKMNQALEDYAQLHGYPNRAALLGTCAKATYTYMNDSGQAN